MDGNMDSRIDSGLQGSPERRGGATEGTVARAKDSARDALADVREVATERVESRKNRAADTLSNVARSLRSSTDQLQGDDFGAGQYIRQAAEQVDRLAGYLQDRDVNEMLDQAEDFARRQPALFVGTAFAMGLLGARFLKSSRERLDRERYGDTWDSREYNRPMTDYSDDFYSRPSGATYPDAPAGRTTDYGTSRGGPSNYGSTEPPSRQMGYAASPESREGTSDRSDEPDPGMR